jgi:pilus assembly protein Flp/PilA
VKKKASLQYPLLRRLMAGALATRVIENAKAFLVDDEGATMVEYGLMVALIAIVCIVAVTNIGTNLNAVFSDIAASL